MTRITIAGAATLVAFLAFSSLVPAADKVWTGAGTTRAMSEGANWQGGVAPSTGDRLFFPAVTQFAQNDIDGASFDSLWFSGDGDPNHGFMLYGYPITLTGSPTVMAQGLTVWFVTTPLVFTSTNPRILTTGTATPNDSRPALAFSGPMQLSGGLMEVVADVGSIGFQGNISEVAETQIQIAGVYVALDGDNSFTGRVTTFGGGGLSAVSANAFGSRSSPTVIQGDTHLDLGRYDPIELVIPEPFELASTYQSPYWGTVTTWGQVRLTGNIALVTRQLIQPEGQATIDGVVSGEGHLEMGRSDGVLTLNNGANSFTGGVTVSRGTLRAGNSLALSLGNDVVVDAQGVLDVGPTFQGVGGLVCAGRIGAITGWGLISVRGPLALSNCTLDLAPANPAFVPRSQEVVTILENDSGAPFNQEFVGYPEGTVINVNGVQTRATYHAGAAGNDFALVAEALPVANVIALAGTPQSLALGATSATAFVARALDAWARPLPNARITFTAPAGCGTFGGSSSAQVLTDAFGVATSPAFTAGNASQVCVVQAKGDAGGAASFEVHLYSLADVVLTAIPASLSTVVSQPFNVAAELRGANGMSLPGLQVSFEAVTRGNSGVASLSPTVVTDAASSRAVAAGVANDKSGNYDIVVRFGTLARTVAVSQKAR